MLFLVLLITLVLAGMRLYGFVGVTFQAIAHVFVGLLIGLSLSTHNWLTVLCAVVLCLIEGYAVISKYWPALAVGNLLAKLNPPAPVVKK